MKYVETRMIDVTPDHGVQIELYGNTISVSVDGVTLLRCNDVRYSDIHIDPKLKEFCKED